jgi:3-phosphoshikimate 1-carboxyvinyltransferase
MHLGFTQNIKFNGSLTISGSKSESNRALLLQKFLPNLKIQNLSDSDDTQYLKRALENSNSEINIGHAGTAMRFLTAYYAIQEGTTVSITGSDRMKERPIQVLVDALRNLGADISYIENDGFPPLKIIGKKLNKHKVAIKADVSSQYISALLLIAPFLENGLELELIGEITSLPYLQMTLSLLEQIGVKTHFDGTRISIEKIKEIQPQPIYIESDWSSASYYYSIMALSEVGSTLNLSHFKKDSLQGDRVLSELYQNFGVQTLFNDQSITLKKVANELPEGLFKADFTECPDIAQTLAVTCLAIGVNAHFTGLHTLKIKETDRVQALKNEMEKLGATVQIDDTSLWLATTKNPNSNVSIQTYNDHRMAMAFAPLAMKIPLNIENPEVVTKSYPNFWNDINQILNNTLI